jgi:glycosyltransferase involved in cell wall biosynthesis
MDRYGQELARHLPVAAAEVDLGPTSAGAWGLARLAPGSLRRLPADLAVVRRLRALPGLLHLTNHHLGRFARHLRRPYVITAHDLIRHRDALGETAFISRPGGRDRRLILADYEGVARAAAVIVPSRAVAGDVVSRLGVAPERVHVVPLGIDHERLRPTRRRLAHGRHLLFVGSEHPRKDLPTLLRALAELRREPRFADVRLVKVGDPGSEEADFRRPVAGLVRALGLGDAVTFTGAVPDADLPAYYGGAQCCVLPSLAEGFGIPPLEAMACGCPVVVSTAGALPEVAGPAALTVPPGDPRALARALAALLDDPGARAALRARGLAHAARFTWERCARETLAVYAAGFPALAQR